MLKKLIYIYPLILISLAFLSSCKDEKKNTLVTPWGEVLQDTIPFSEDFTVSDIVSNGELIILTLSGPESYYDYRGRGMGLQYLLCEKFAQKLGVSLRVEVCKDTLEMISRLNDGDADLIAYFLPKDLIKKDSLTFCQASIDSLNVGWAVAKDNYELADSLNSWFKPTMIAEVKKEENHMLSSSSVKRHIYSPFKNKEQGIISSYDYLFKKYASRIRWDWRLMAAQCYQESCFDPMARSWAGARGLMQIMPATAAHLGLPMTSINDPEANIKAAASYIEELTSLFGEIPNFGERQLFVLAAYNGGYMHIKDAMALANKHGKDSHKWKNVAPYVLGLQQASFYTDPVVKFGYMRGSETVAYVDKIRERYAQYSGGHYSGTSIKSAPAPKSPTPSMTSPYTPQKAKKKRRFNI